jgi:hypothetical protein
MRSSFHFWEEHDLFFDVTSAASSNGGRRVQQRTVACALGVTRAVCLQVHSSEDGLCIDEMNRALWQAVLAVAMQPAPVVPADAWSQASETS